MACLRATACLRAITYLRASAYLRATALSKELLVVSYRAAETEPTQLSLLKLQLRFADITLL